MALLDTESDEETPIWSVPELGQCLFARPHTVLSVWQNLNVGIFSVSIKSRLKSVKLVMAIISDPSIPVIPDVCYHRLQFNHDDDDDDDDDDNNNEYY